MKRKSYVISKMSIRHTLLILLLTSSVLSETSVKDLEYVDQMIFDEIDAIKTKVWVEIGRSLDVLTEELDIIKRKNVTCECTPQFKDTEPRGKNSDLETKYQNLLRAFGSEKRKSRALEKHLNIAISQISELKNLQSEDRKTVENLGEKANILSDDLAMIESNIDQIEISQENLVQDLSNLNTTLTASCSKQKYKHRFSSPTFVSDWILMRAQDEDYCQRLVAHGLDVLPYKVEVQIRPTSGPNSGWTFHGDSAFQSDDDNGQVYGGIVYFYNETHVILVAPKKNNDKAAGVIINTGESNNRRLGNNHQTLKEAYVRIKVWAPSDLPEPDFITDWLPLDITNSTLAYYELAHEIGSYPELINVQIRVSSPMHSLISEGLGSTLQSRGWSHAGGVVYAFDDKTVRLWTGYLPSLQGTGKYRLVGVNDGWGSVPFNGVKKENGEFRIIAFSSERKNRYEREITTSNTDISEWPTLEHVSLEKDLLSFWVEATDGPNKGFRFPGYGNSQSIDEPFGGVVYAFNSAGDIRIWRPNPESNGFMIHVHSPYGNGRNVQASNNATFVSNLITTKPCY